MKRKVDNLGRIVIPKEIRTELEINEGDSLEINLIDRKIVLTNSHSTNYEPRVKSALKTIDENLDLDGNPYEMTILTQVKYILEKGSKDEDNNSYR